MPIAHTHNGFPVLITSAEDGVYHDPRIDALYKSRAESVVTGKSLDELEQVSLLYQIYLATGGIFKAAMDPSAKYSATTRDFIGDTAMFITKGSTRRAIPFSEYGVLISADQLVSEYATQVYTTDRLAAVSRLSMMEPHEVFQMWLVNAGVDDICRTLQLYVGKAL